MLQQYAAGPASEWQRRLAHQISNFKEKLLPSVSVPYPPVQILEELTCFMSKTLLAVIDKQMTVSGAALRFRWADALGSWPIFSLLLMINVDIATTKCDQIPCLIAVSDLGSTPLPCLPIASSLAAEIKTLESDQANFFASTRLPLAWRAHLQKWLVHFKRLVAKMFSEVQACSPPARDRAIREAIGHLAQIEHFFFLKSICPAGTAIVHTKFGYRICVRMDDRSPVETSLVHYGLWDDCEIVPRLLPRSDVDCGFLVVGANIGTCVLYAASMGHRVIAIEPEPSNLEMLRKSLGLVQEDWISEFHVEVIAAAASNRSGRETLYLNSVNTAGNSLRVVANENDSIEVDVVTLDSLGLRGVCAMMIDAEGADFEVLLGALNLLRDKELRAISFEWVPQLLRSIGYDPLKILNLLAEVDFDLFYDDLTGPIDPAEWGAMAEYQEGDFNLIALRRQSGG